MVIDMNKGKIFSIEEFSVFDGPGIRTSVFLKGCPLNCMWCQNPEGQSFNSQLIRSPNGCLNCGKCFKKGLELTGKSQLVKESISVCPRRLIRVCGEDFSPQELVWRISENFDMLNAAGGGVTFSGGEPLAQPDFLIACLKLIEGKTNRALQTTGYADTKIFENVLKNCDYFLYDLKLINDQKHKQYTGVSNKQILENFITLVKSGKKFCVRTPLIPTVTDTKENAEDTAKFLFQNGVNYIELLPYNKMAGSKYTSLGKTYSPTFDQNKDVEIHTEIFSKYDIEVHVL